MKHLPKAIVDTAKLTDAKIIPYAKAFAAGLLAQTVTFPDPPFDDVAITALINTYATKLAKAIKGTEADTINKDAAKQELINAIRADVTYINQVVTKTFQTTPSMNLDALRALILSTGLKASKIPGRPNTSGNSRVATPISIVAKNKGKGGANVNGVIRIRVNATAKYNSAAIKTFWLQYRTQAIPANPPAPAVPAGLWQDYISTSSRIEVINVDAGVYDYMTAPVIGVSMGKDQLNWSPIAKVIVT